MDIAGARLKRELAKLKGQYRSALEATLDRLAACDSVADWESGLSTFLTQSIEQIIQFAELHGELLPRKRMAERVRDAIAKTHRADFAEDFRLDRLRLLVGAYEQRLVPELVLPSAGRDDADDPWPDRPGMEAAYHIVAGWISLGLVPGEEVAVSAGALKKWRVRLGASRRAREPFRIHIHPWDLEVRVVHNPIPGLLDRLPQNGGYRGRGPNCC